MKHILEVLLNAIHLNYILETSDLIIVLLMRNPIFLMPIPLGLTIELELPCHFQKDFDVHSCICFIISAADTD